jgi:NADPH:quinone reductase
MKAVVCREFAPIDALRIADAPDPEVAAGHVLIDVHAAGVNFPDVLMVQDKYQFKPALPFAPGGEISGTVSAVGSEVTGWQVGDLVAAGTGTGGFAEKVAIDAGRAFRIPEGVDLTAAAGFLTTYGTSYHALRDRANLQPGETLLVLGAAGGVGLSAVELGAAMGAKVIAGASSEEKLAVCRQFGAAETVNYAEVDLKSWLKEHTGGKGVDVVYDPVGGDLSEAALRNTAWKGRFLVIGFAAGPIPELPSNRLLLKEVAALGVFWGEAKKRDPALAAGVRDALLARYRAGRLDPLIGGRFPLSEARTAVAELAARRTVGKILLTPDPVGH